MEWYWILAIVLGSLLLLFLLSWLLYKPFFKRFWDIVLSGLAILVLSPFLIILIVLGSIFMRGNPFFIQERVGKKKKNGKEKIFKLVKFRSMSNKKDKNGELLPDELRLGKYGRFIRATSLDELPELFNIFAGDMSIIGPRPLPTIYLPYYNEDERHRHDVRPGLSGLAQVNGRNSLSWEEKFGYDLLYVSSISIWFDLKIVFMTVKKVLKRSDIGQGEERPISLHVLRSEEYHSNNEK